ncbi:MAG: ribonuclease [Clostridia bacterium]|nr:ribonuclease [Clostridia bacterium]
MKNAVGIIFTGVFLCLVLAVFTGCEEVSQDDVISALEGIQSLLEETSPDTTELESTVSPDRTTEGDTDAVAGEPATDAEEVQETETEAADTTEVVVAYGEYYYDVENVVLYLDTYGELPENYMTKDEAGDLGWEGGSVEKYQDGAAIGGDRFGNYENLLPDSEWIECDIDTEDEKSRGAKRLVFSLEDGLYYYTDDHYETFVEVYITEDGEVEYR